MKLLRFGPAGVEKPGVLDADGGIRDLSAQVDDIGGDVLGDEGLDRLRALDLDALPRVDGSPRLGPPVARTQKLIAVGLNYVDHAAEAGMPIPEEPILFSKAVSCISGPNDDIVLQPHVTKGDWEIELAIIVGRTATNIGENDALGHVAGYTICNDVSERAFQLESTGQWFKGKSLDTFGPIGPWLVTRDEVLDPHVLALWLEVNGERRQSSNTSNMIFSVPKLVSYISQFMTLVPGDVIATGTPPGVAMGMDEPPWLQPGDRVHLFVEGLGEQRQTVVRTE
ncbi:MAG: fumarylacetoacetate hydrolase family protein [Methyloligellaceae bacterium]